MLRLVGAEAVVAVGGRWDDEDAHGACQMSGGKVEGTPAHPLECLYGGCSVVGHMAARGAAAAWLWNRPLEARENQDRVGTVNSRGRGTKDHRRELLGE